VSVLYPYLDNSISLSDPAILCSDAVWVNLKKERTGEDFSFQADLRSETKDAAKRKREKHL
jgi:hypothetical protein